jgi:hypothetical protein
LHVELSKEVESPKGKNPPFSAQAIAKHISGRFDIGKEHVFKRNLNRALK